MSRRFFIKNVEIATKEYVDNHSGGSEVNRLLYIPDDPENFDVRDFYITTNVPEHELTKKLLKAVDDFNNGITTSICIYTPGSITRSFPGGLFEFVYVPNSYYSNTYFFKCNDLIYEDSYTCNSIELRVYHNNGIPTEVNSSKVQPTVISDDAIERRLRNYTPGYDSTKTQVLKNVNGTFTWVDED